MGWNVIARYLDSPPVQASCSTEADAEEVGAALALAGFHALVYKNGDVYHEFFGSEK